MDCFICYVTREDSQFAVGVWSRGLAKRLEELCYDSGAIYEVQVDLGNSHGDDVLVFYVLVVREKSFRGFLGLLIEVPECAAVINTWHPIARLARGIKHLLAIDFSLAWTGAVACCMLTASRRVTNSLRWSLCRGEALDSLVKPIDYPLVRPFFPIRWKLILHR